MGETVIGLIGLGEAGASIATGLTAAGADVHAFDVRRGDAAIQGAADRAGALLVDSLQSLAAKSTIILALTSASSAEPVARELAQHLRPGHLFSDWNSAGPAAKRRIGDLTATTGAVFVDGAVMAAVPPLGHRVPVLVSGAAAPELRDRLAVFGTDLEVVGDQPGEASAVKMFRSLLVKGLEAVLLEFALGSAAFGVTDRVLESMNGTLPSEDWTVLARYLLTRSTQHAGRRAAELREVVDTLADAGVEPVMAGAGVRRLEELDALRLEPVRDESYAATIARIRKAAGLP